jgi:hypothetical protein
MAYNPTMDRLHLLFTAALGMITLAASVPACADNTDTPDPPDPPACECSPSQACIAGACAEAARAEIERGCNPLTPIADPTFTGEADSWAAECMLPWPSNFFTAPSDGAKTGLRLAYDSTVVPTNDSSDPFPAADYERFDGFSPSSQIRFLFPAGVDPTSLPPIDDLPRSLDPDSPVVLLQAETGERWLHFAEVDARAPSPDRQVVFVRPMKRMDFGARYIVAVRDLVDAAGKPIEPTPVFRALRDGQTTDVPAIEALRPRYDALFADLEKAGIPRGTLQLAWDFTTASNEVLTRDARHILPDMKKRAENGDLGFTITEVQTDPPDLPDLKLMIRGTFKVPSYLTGDSGPGQVFARDAEGLPQYQGLADADMYIAVPRKVWDSGAPAPVYLWGHGLLGGGEEAYYIASAAQDFIGIGIDFWGMSYRDVDVLGGAIFPNNMAGGHTVPERLLQAAFNFSTLAYLVKGDLPGAPELQKEGVALIDPTRVEYMGGSQGGILGGTVMGVSPHFTRGGLIVGGGVYSLMVWRNTSWPSIESIWRIYHDDPLERELLFAMFQSQYDVAEPATYADHLWRSPFEGNPEKRILLVEAWNDSQVANISTEMMARTYGIPMRAPALYSVPGVPDETAPIDGSALLQVDTKNNDPLPPKKNLAPAGENGAHGSVADSAAVQQILVDFLLTGQVVHHCDGPCDPD